MSRALVLGGGGPVGIGWESGLVVGLAGTGVDLRRADLVVGTSAGSAVGAQLTLGLDVAESLSLVAAAGAGDAGASDPEGLEKLMAAMAAATQDAASPVEARRSLGRLSIESETFDEEIFVALFATLAGSAWPAGYSCTAVDVESGELQVWDAAGGVPLERAIASSCSVPGIFPPVTVNGRRYMDGGMRTAVNADLAAGHDAVVVVSCFPLALPEGMSDPAFDAMTAPVHAELDTLRDGGSRVEVIVPGEEFLEISGWGLNLMDYNRAAGAYDAGLRQAAVEAERIGAAWS